MATVIFLNFPISLNFQRMDDSFAIYRASIHLMCYLSNSY